MLSVTVEVPRTLRVGQSVRINSSYAYAGIDDGVVKILGLGYKEDLYADKSLDENIVGGIEGHIDAEVGNDDGERPSLQAVLEGSIWVVYQYSPKDDYPYVLPLDTFVEHLSVL